MNIDEKRNIHKKTINFIRGGRSLDQVSTDLRAYKKGLDIEGAVISETGLNLYQCAENAVQVYSTQFKYLDTASESYEQDYQAMGSYLIKAVIAFQEIALFQYRCFYEGVFDGLAINADSENATIAETIRQLDEVLDRNRQYSQKFEAKELQLKSVDVLKSENTYEAWFGNNGYVTGRFVDYTLHPLRYSDTIFSLLDSVDTAPTSISQVDVSAEERNRREAAALERSQLETQRETRQAQRLLSLTNRPRMTTPHSYGPGVQSDNFFGQAYARGNTYGPLLNHYDSAPNLNGCYSSLRSSFPRTPNRPDGNDTYEAINFRTPTPEDSSYAWMSQTKLGNRTYARISSPTAASTPVPGNDTYEFMNVDIPEPTPPSSGKMSVRAALGRVPDRSGHPKRVWAKDMANQPEYRTPRNDHLFQRRLSDV